MARGDIFTDVFDDKTISFLEAYGFPTPPKDVTYGEDVFLGTYSDVLAGNENSYIEVYATCIPAISWRFKVHAYRHTYQGVRTAKDYEIKTGSGKFSDYWKMAWDLYGGGCSIIITKEETFGRKDPLDNYYEALNIERHGFTRDQFEDYSLRIGELTWLVIDPYGFVGVYRKNEWPSKHHPYDKITLPKPVRDEKSLIALLKTMGVS